MAFHIAGRSAELTEELYEAVRYSKPRWPRCFKWIAVRPSGLIAEELLLVLITSSGVRCGREWWAVVVCSRVG
jgi:hypothetical protein